MIIKIKYLCIYIPRISQEGISLLPANLSHRIMIIQPFPIKDIRIDDVLLLNLVKRSKKYDGNNHKHILLRCFIFLEIYEQILLNTFDNSVI